MKDSAPRATASHGSPPHSGSFTAPPVACSSAEACVTADREPIMAVVSTARQQTTRILGSFMISPSCGTSAIRYGRLPAQLCRKFAGNSQVFCRIAPVEIRFGSEVHLSPKAFELLATLVAERPKVLSKVLRRSACGHGPSSPQPT